MRDAEIVASTCPRVIPSAAAISMFFLPWSFSATTFAVTVPGAGARRPVAGVLATGGMASATWRAPSADPSPTLIIATGISVSG